MTRVARCSPRASVRQTLFVKLDTGADCSGKSRAQFTQKAARKSAYNSADCRPHVRESLPDLNYPELEINTASEIISLNSPNKSHCYRIRF
jgi:hypothetical protein